MNSTQTETTTTPRKKVDATTGNPAYDLDTSDEKVDATTGDPAYDVSPTPGGNGGQPDPDRKNPDRSPDPTEPERQPPPIHEPEPPHDPIREPLEGDQDLGKRSEMTPGRQ